MTLRDEFYFEPRVIENTGRIRWYGETYTGGKILEHMGETVYIRDTGRELFIYTLDSDQTADGSRVEAVFSLVCKVRKYNDKWRYGKKNS